MHTSPAQRIRNSGHFKSAILNTHSRANARSSGISPDLERRRWRSVLRTKSGLNECLLSALHLSGFSGLKKYASGLYCDGLMLSIQFWWDGTVYIQMPSGQWFPMTSHEPKQLVKLSLKDRTIFLSLMKLITSKPPNQSALVPYSAAAMKEFLQSSLHDPNAYSPSPAHHCPIDQERPTL